MNFRSVILGILVCSSLPALSQKLKVNTSVGYLIKIANVTPVAAHELIIDNHFQFIKEEKGNSETKGYRLYILENTNEDDETIYIYKYTETGYLGVRFPLNGMDVQRKKMLPYKIGSKFDEAGDLEITYRYLGQKMKLTQGKETATLIIYPK